MKKMMVGKEDLALSLSLGSMENHHRFPASIPLQLNLMPSPSPQQFQWSNLFSHPTPEIGSPEPMMRGIDVNRSPLAERESEEDGGASSPNSTLSSVSGKLAERDPGHLSSVGGDKNDGDRSSSRCGGSDEDDADGSRKKLRLSKDQSAILEESFKEHNALNPFLLLLRSHHLRHTMPSTTPRSQH